MKALAKVNQKKNITYLSAALQLQVNISQAKNGTVMKELTALL